MGSTVKVGRTQNQPAKAANKKEKGKVKKKKKKKNKWRNERGNFITVKAIIKVRPTMKLIFFIERKGSEE